MKYDCIVIGGGFYGCMLALELHQKFKKILILEKENDILTRASLINQARIHGGYHYPRSLV
ncbi:FAD-dependent oxidoreductase, partial [Helicobacter sp.]